MQKRQSGLSGKSIIISLITLLIVHLIVIAVYAQYQRDAGKQAWRNDIVQQILSVLYLAKNTPADQLDQMISAVNRDKFIVTLSRTPSWPYQLKAESFWQINSELHKETLAQQLSFQLSNEQWLNFDISLVSTDKILSIFLVVLETLLAVTVLFSAWSIERFTGPLRKFKAAAERLSTDMNSPPLEEQGPAIVKQTAIAMNLMQRRIRELVQNRTQMLAAISHDLRTPLTRLKLRAQFITDLQQLEKTMNDLDEMDAMIEQILSYARDTLEQEVAVWLDLNSLVSAICDDTSSIGYSVSLDSPDTRLPFRGRVLALKRAFSNIINNAVKYADGAVRIQIKNQHQQTVITIDDDGPGIPEDELNAVMDPFYRVDRARSSETGGTGLGLSIAQDVICSHEGTIKLSNREEGGLRVVICLPVMENVSVLRK